MSTLDLDELIGIAKKVVNQEVPVNERCRAKFENIVSYLSYQFYHTNQNYIDSREDLEEEMWIKIFQMLKNYDYNLDALSPNLVYITCKNRCCDYYNAERYKYRSKICKFDEAAINPGGSSESDGSKHSDRSDISSTLDRLSHTKFDVTDDNIVFENIVDLFEKGSRKRKYVVTKLYYAGLIRDDFKYIDEVVKTADDLESSYLLSIVNRNNSKNTKVSGAWIVEKQEMSARIKYYLRYHDSKNGDYTPESYSSILIDYVKENNGYVKVDYVLKHNWSFKGKFYHDELLNMIKCTDELAHYRLKGVDYIVYNITEVTEDLLNKGFGKVR